MDAILKQLPWLMSVMTIATMWFAGSHWRYTWALSILSQALWLTWIVTTENWGFLPMNICMWIVSVRNHFRWAKNLDPKA